MTKPILPIPVAPDCVAAAEQTGLLCESLGHAVGRAVEHGELEPLTWRSMEAGRAVSAVDYS